MGAVTFFFERSTGWLSMYDANNSLYFYKQQMVVIHGLIEQPRWNPLAAIK
jgi:hypothetical protein